MKFRGRVTNHGLAALIEGSGFSSLDRFGEALNARAWEMHGVKVYYDHVSIKRWLRGSVCQYPEVVAVVLSDAWGVPIPVGVIWPNHRDGEGPVPAYLQPWVAARTLEELGIFLRSDMLTRRDVLSGVVGLATGQTLIDPLTRWLGSNAIGLTAGHDSGGRIGMSTVAAIERSTRYFSAMDAEIGGGLSREAAVGQLKYAVDLAQQASYSTSVGTRLLAAIADLSSLVGWMSFDAGMNGPAQQYFVYGLQAAHEADDENTRLGIAAILGKMSYHMRAVGHPDTALQLINMALNQVPNDRRRYNTVRATLWNLRAHMMAPMGVSYLPEIRNAISLAVDLYGESQHDETDPTVSRFWKYASEAELAGVAAISYRDLADEKPELADESEHLTLRAIERRSPGFGRSQTFDQILLARTRFLRSEPEQACVDGVKAIDMAAKVAASKRVTSRLRDLMADSEPYQSRPDVKEFREHLRLVLAN